MQDVRELLDRKNELNQLKQVLDKDASLDSWEGSAYTRCLVDLVLTEMAIEEIEKAAH